MALALASRQHRPSAATGAPPFSPFQQTFDASLPPSPSSLPASFLLASYAVCGASRSKSFMSSISIAREMVKSLKDLAPLRSARKTNLGLN